MLADLEERKTFWGKKQELKHSMIDDTHIHASPFEPNDPLRYDPEVNITLGRSYVELELEQEGFKIVLDHSEGKIFLTVFDEKSNDVDNCAYSLEICESPTIFRTRSVKVVDVEKDREALKKSLVERQA